MKQIFQKESISKKDLILSNDGKYEITKYTQEFSIEFKSGNQGGSVAKGNLCFVIGIYDENLLCKIDGKEEKQNLKLCKFDVEDCAKMFKRYNF